MTKVKKPTWIGTGLNEVGSIVRGLAERDLPCLVVGPTGTGKELLTQLYAFTWQTKRRKYRYHRLNCTGFVEGLLTSHLFGYEGGTFTGSDPKGRSGLVEANDLVCLDELGDATESFQAQVLRVVEYGTFTKVGGTAEMRTECCFIGSTSKLEKIRSDLRFLFHVVHIPPLALRPQDFQGLVAHLCARLDVREFTDRFAAWSAAYLWPGNVRELMRKVELAAIGVDRLLDVPSREEFFRDPVLYRSLEHSAVRNSTIDRMPLSQFPAAFESHYSASSAESELRYADWQAAEREQSPVAKAIDRLGSRFQRTGSGKEFLEMWGLDPERFRVAGAPSKPTQAPQSPQRRQEIEVALRQERSRIGAARALGISRDQIAREIKRLGIDATAVINEGGGTVRVAKRAARAR